MKNKIYNRNKGHNNPFYGKRHSEETKRKMSEIRIKKKETLGYLHTPESKRKISETMKKIANTPKNKLRVSSQMRGKNNPSWRGGISFEPYGLEFNNRFKEMIRERDNYCCILCNIKQEDIKIRLDVHHIDYDKLNSFVQNCLALCRGCHVLTNFNREQWKSFFQSLLKKRYGYEYTQDQKIILEFKPPKEI